MAASEIIQSMKANLVLNNGLTPSGNIRTITQTMGALDKNAWDVDKVSAIAGAMAEVLDKTLYMVQGVKTYSIMED